MEYLKIGEELIGQNYKTPREIKTRKPYNCSYCTKTITKGSLAIQIYARWETNFSFNSASQLINQRELLCNDNCLNNFISSANKKDLLVLGIETFEGYCDLTVYRLD